MVEDTAAGQIMGTFELLARQTFEEARRVTDLVFDSRLSQGFSCVETGTHRCG